MTLLFFFAISGQILCAPVWGSKLFDSVALLNITINLKTEDILAIDQPTASTIKLSSGDTIDVVIKKGGNWRLKNCDFPPLKIKFASSDQTKGGDFENQSSLKLVTQCNRGERAEFNKREYLSYKLYQQITDLSFGVRAVSVKYLDGPPQFSFFIERTTDLSNRSKMVYQKGMYRVDPKKVENDNALRAHLFNHFIGNEDYAFAWDLLHNVKLFKKYPELKLYVIPYDFDFSDLTFYKRFRSGPYIKRFCYSWDRVLPEWRKFTRKLVDLRLVISEMDLLGAEKKILLDSFDVASARFQKEEYIKSVVENSHKYCPSIF